MGQFSQTYYWDVESHCIRFSFVPKKRHVYRGNERGFGFLVRANRKDEHKHTKRWKMDVNQWKKGERIDSLYEDDLFLDHQSWNTWKYSDVLVNYYVGSCLC